jgi:hypothetical protein|tara:strand:- start:328 stop:663 length:336 start_codon:yes stop_codon:yes gene_type:complete
VFNIEQIQKNNEQEYKNNKKNINFRLSGNNKYYYANQCRIFKEYLEKYGFNGFNHYSAQEIKDKGVSFNEYSINLGYNQYCADIKRFNNKQELLGFVIGYNEALQGLRKNH